MNQDAPARWWDVFEDAIFKATYLDRGSWHVDAWYERVRYYWRVDDKTLAVKGDNWLEPDNAVSDPKLLKLDNPRIEC